MAATAYCTIVHYQKCTEMTLVVQNSYSYFGNNYHMIVEWQDTSAGPLLRQNKSSTSLEPGLDRDKSVSCSTIRLCYANQPDELPELDEDSLRDSRSCVSTSRINSLSLRFCFAFLRLCPHFVWFSPLFNITCV